jgi:hypothetical protein
MSTIELPLLVEVETDRYVLTEQLTVAQLRDALPIARALRDKCQDSATSYRQLRRLAKLVFEDAPDDARVFDVIGVRTPGTLLDAG